jgi:hypothetical protein
MLVVTAIRRGRRTLKAFMLAFLAVLLLAVAPVRKTFAQNESPSPQASSAIDEQIRQGKYVIAGSFFGMHINRTSTYWPLAQVGGVRLRASQVNWDQIEKTPGVYDFSLLDQWIAEAQQNKATVMYNFVAVPQFYSSAPGDTTCDYAPGACDPPTDLNADGTGADSAFKNFVTALVNHVGSQIRYWEIWNEPNQKSQWVPTNPALPYNQLIRMAKDAREIIQAVDPNAVLLTPAPVGFPTGAPLWLAGYLAAGGGAYADVIAFHGYLNQYWKWGAYPIAEDEVRLVSRVKYWVAKYGQQGKPLWISEGGWGNVQLTGFTNPKLQTAFIARYVLLQQSLGIAQAYWYQWDSRNGAGTLWMGPRRDQLREPGFAYRQVADWTVGATLSSPCTPSPNGVWKCTYTRSGNYQAMAVWNAFGHSRFRVPPQYKQYRGLMGHVYPVKGSVIIGPWPILLEN